MEGARQDGNVIYTKVTFPTKISWNKKIRINVVQIKICLMIFITRHDLYYTLWPWKRKARTLALVGIFPSWAVGGGMIVLRWKLRRAGRTGCSGMDWIAQLSYPAAGTYCYWTIRHSDHMSQSRTLVCPCRLTELDSPPDGQTPSATSPVGSPSQQPVPET
jgi:hypothetical protein